MQGVGMIQYTDMMSRLVLDTDYRILIPLCGDVNRGLRLGASMCLTKDCDMRVETPALIVPLNSFGDPVMNLMREVSFILLVQRLKELRDIVRLGEPQLINNDDYYLEVQLNYRGADKLEAVRNICLTIPRHGTSLYTLCGGDLSKVKELTHVGICNREEVIAGWSNLNSSYKTQFRQHHELVEEINSLLLTWSKSK